MSKCPNCGPLGNDFCTWEGHWGTPDAPVAEDHGCEHPKASWNLCAKGCAFKPISRAELIELMQVTWRDEGADTTWPWDKVLDALIKAGITKL